MPYHRCADCGLTSYSAAAHTVASVCPTCTAPLDDATRLYLTPGATHTINRGLAARLEAAAEARQERKLVAGLLRDRKGDDCSPIEELTGRKVIGFMSDNHIDPDLAVEVFVLEPLVQSAPNEPRR